jgi:hypothetical protein
MTPVQEKLAEIKAKREEESRLWATLDLWANVQAQGIEPEEVESFGFDPDLLPSLLKRKRQYAMGGGGFDPCVERLPNGQYRALFYTYVRLKGGSIKTLDPPVRTP